MESFAIDPPRYLYRIDYPSSATHFHPETGFLARITGALPAIYNYPPVFGEAVKKHLRWSNREWSMFISVFESERHAENWARCWSRRQLGAECTMVKIDGRALGGILVYRAQDVCDTLNLDVPLRAQSATEYLVLQRIPVEAIVSSRTIKEE